MKISWRVLLLPMVALSGCVVINNYPGRPLPDRYPFGARPQRNLQPASGIGGDQNPTLFITLIDEKKKLIGSCYLQKRHGDTLDLAIQIQNFKKDSVVKIDVSILDTAFKKNSLVQLNPQTYLLNYRSYSPSQDTTVQSAAFSDIRINTAGGGVFHTYQGLMANNTGNRYSFWCQTDPLNLESVFSISILTVFLMEQKKHFLDLCTDRIRKLKRQCPGAYAHGTFTRPLLEIGNVPIGKELISDCDVICPPAKK